MPISPKSPVSQTLPTFVDLSRSHTPKCLRFVVNPIPNFLRTMRHSSVIALLLTLSHLLLLAFLISYFLSKPTSFRSTLHTNDLSESTTDPLFYKNDFNRTIAFFFLSGGHLVPQLQAYAVLSACKHHLTWQVLVFKRPWIIKPKLWTGVKNLIILNLNETYLMQDTPLMKWFSEDWSHSQLYDYHLGDALRLAFLYKYGGVYLDTDVFVLKSLQDLPPNCIGYEDKENRVIDGAVMKFEAKHQFIRLAMQKFVQEFRDAWAYQGPALMTRAAKEYNNRLDDLTVLDYSYFYPISWQNFEIKILFKAKNKTDAKKMIEDSYAVHLWNKATKRYSIEKGSILQELMEQVSNFEN